MPSVPISFREAKEPVDSGRPYLKSLTKKKEKKKPKSAKVERQKKKPKCVKKRGYAKRG